VRNRNLFLAALALAACSDPDQPSTGPGAPADAPEMAVAASNNWVSRTDMPGTVVSDFAMASVTNASGQSIVYVVGGRRADGIRMGSTKAYNASTNTWSSKADLPTAIHSTNGMGVIKGKLYISGGYGDNHGVRNTLYVYDPVTNQWTRKRDMPSCTYGGVSGVLNDQLYVLSGSDDPEACSYDSPVKAFYRYDPALDQWTSLPLPTERHYRGMAGVMGGKFYVVGGFDADQAGDTGTLEAFDPVTNQWTTKTPLAHPRWLAAGTAVSGKLYVIGGYGVKADGTTSAIPTNSIYDPATDTWTNRQAMPSARVGIGAARVAVNGQVRVEVAGGPRPGNNVAYIP
jgi:N-acetylneuraminic acid mutarotase